MCGLVAHLAQGAPPAYGLLSQVMHTLSHRGPDGEGRWRSVDGRVGLGHRRLAIVDVDGGAQPLVSPDGQVVAVVNGELYDEQALRRRLEAEGCRFSTRSDSELVVHLYQSHGVDFLRHLRGEFALVLWDARQRRLLAARDRFGVRPLLWARVGQTLWLASEVQALLRAGLRARWDEAALHQALHLQYLLPGQSLLQGVHSLPPGHALIADADGERIVRWWTPEIPEPSTARTPEALARRVSALVDEAVRLRLRAEVPVAVQLSGGLDSSLVAASAAARGALLPAFTVAFDTPPWDERDHAAAVARHLGLAHHVVPVGEEALVEALPEAVAHTSGPLINAHAPAKWLLARQVRAAGYRVMLTGEGADELALGYAHFRYERSAEAERAALSAREQVTTGIHLPRGDTLPTEALARAFGAVPGFLAAKATLGWRVSTLLADDARQRWRQRDAAAAVVDAFAGRRLPADPVRRSQRLWLELGLPAYVLQVVGDPMMAAHGVEDRLPLLDHGLFEALAAAPVGWLIRDGVEKWPLREAARGRLPEAICARPKQPFMAPPMRPGGPLLRRAEAVFAADPLPGILDRVALLALVRRWPDLAHADRVAWDPALWMALSLGMLQKRYSVEAPW
ncbi:MAG: asparagine synthase (glutamine-hydrolyzing) [Alphaproteobacteria bacterium]|nr:asparagine synthase (glutamine-hydrolyzing) [Alphaproteobacteria bacterium]